MEESGKALSAIIYLGYIICFKLCKNNNFISACTFQNTHKKLRIVQTLKGGEFLVWPDMSQTKLVSAYIKLVFKSAILLLYQNKGIHACSILLLDGLALKF